MSSSVSPETLLAAARQAAEKSYSPYSDFPVGAALLLENGDVVTGCNVENISYGLTICAEQTAVVKAVSEGKKDFKALAVWASEKPNGAVTPCGACRQILSEFLTAGTPVYFNDDSGELIEQTMAGLLPAAFDELP